MNDTLQNDVLQGYTINDADQKNGTTKFHKYIYQQNDDEQNDNHLNDA